MRLLLRSAGLLEKEGSIDMIFMRKRILVLFVVVIAALFLSSCAGSTNIPASGNDRTGDLSKEAKAEAGAGSAESGTEDTSPEPGVGGSQAGSSGIEALGNTPPELYPAYIMDGTEKKWGYIDSKGDFAIRPVYEYAADFQKNGTAIVSENGMWGLIDKSDRKIVEPGYVSLISSSDSTSIAFDGNGKSFLLDRQGRLIFQTEGTIERASCGLSAFSKKTENDDFLWGYINEEGRVVIEPTYLWAHPFVDDKALVEVSPGHYGVINKDGKLIGDLGKDNVIAMSDDTVIFLRNTGDYTTRYGYKTLDGEILLDAIYFDAQKFENGLAIVNGAQDYSNKYGVINKKGEFVIAPKYSQITSLGEGIYAVPKAVDFYYSGPFLAKALFDKTGKQLTDFKFYDVERVENGLISVTDDRSTYLVDNMGNEAGNLPKTPGIGNIRAYGKLYRVNADEALYYISQEGQMVWQSDNTAKLEGGLEIKQKSFRPDRCMLIFYPELAGMADLAVQKNINALLEDEFVKDRKGSYKEGDLYTETVDIHFSSERNKNLLIITKYGYYYPIGAAHGQPSMEDYHIDLKTGKLYSLKDLFKKGVNYKYRLTNIVRSRIAEMSEETGDTMFYDDDIGQINISNNFVIKKDALVIYFQPYEIAPYAVGFPEFSISFDLLDGLIDTQGEFWKAFERSK